MTLSVSNLNLAEANSQGSDKITKTYHQQALPSFLLCVNGSNLSVLYRSIMSFGALPKYNDIKVRKRNERK